MVEHSPKILASKEKVTTTSTGVKKEKKLPARKKYYGRSYLMSLSLWLCRRCSIICHAATTEVLWKISPWESLQSVDRRSPTPAPVLISVCGIWK